VFSAQEEVGCRGAITAAYDINPDVGIAVDITMAFDTPNDLRYPVSLGGGPAIKVKDASMIVDPKVIGWMEQAAKELQIPHQLEIMPFGGTDASAINLTHVGVPSGCLSIPTRYGHTPSEMVDADDVDHCVRLLHALVSNPVEF
jgi:endoglucanase